MIAQVWRVGVILIVTGLCVTIAACNSDAKDRAKPENAAVGTPQPTIDPCAPRTYNIGTPGSMSSLSGISPMINKPTTSAVATPTVTPCVVTPAKPTGNPTPVNQNTPGFTKSPNISTTQTPNP